MDLVTRYHKEIRNRGFHPDQEQLSVLDSMQEMHDVLHLKSPQRPAFFRFLKRHTKPAPKHDLGVYLWGGVGRGKSWLMDLFLSELNGFSHTRMHYMEFMRQVHMSLQQLHGHTDPLNIIAKRFTQQWRVIGIDEFAVSDVTDAMIWHGLIEALHAQGALLVMTSNLSPQQLYRNGLQRDRFVPTIEKIEAHMNVIHVAGELDYRRRFLEKRKRYYYPADKQAENALRQAFHQGLGDIFGGSKSLLINRRNIQAMQMSEHAAWFDFNELCHGPRSASDYIEIAKRFRTVFVSRVPLLDEHMDDQAWRFIQLIDEFYDQRTKVYISAACEPDKLYRGRRFTHEFSRTISRLYAMQDSGYGKLCA